MQIFSHWQLLIWLLNYNPTYADVRCDDMLLIQPVRAARGWPDCTEVSWSVFSDINTDMSIHMYLKWYTELRAANLWCADDDDVTQLNRLEVRLFYQIYTEHVEWAMRGFHLCASVVCHNILRDISGHFSPVCPVCFCLLGAVFLWECVLCHYENLWEYIK